MKLHLITILVGGNDTIPDPGALQLLSTMPDVQIHPNKVRRPRIGRFRADVGLFQILQE